MNIKNPETYQLARQLSQITGETLTTAVTIAVRERLDRIYSEEKDDYVERLMAITRETAPLFVPPYDTIDHGDLLYGEDGLPN